MAKNFDLVIFDCDGVVVDSEVISCGCLMRALRGHGCEIDLEGVFETFLGRGFQSVREHFRDVWKRPFPEELVDEFQAELRASFARDLKPVEGIEAVLDNLTRPYCLASSSQRDRIDLCLALTGLAQRFEGRIFSTEMVARAKPAPDLFLHAAREMGADPSRALVIEDSVNGVLAGKAAGMTVFGFIGGSHYAGRDGAAILKAAGADRIFSHMSELGPA